jgi:hypothetical protein
MGIWQLLSRNISPRDMGVWYESCASRLQGFVYLGQVDAGMQGVVEGNEVGNIRQGVNRTGRARQAESVNLGCNDPS